jgi:sec-independent protein translocase protein TatA
MGGLGMPEMLVIMVIALIVFGPRKLPELGKTLGKAMGQFRRASEDFKRTWEQEVDIEKAKTYISDTSSSITDAVEGNDHNNNYNNDYSYEDTYGYNAPTDDSADGASTPSEVLTEETPATTESAPKSGWI